MKTQTASKGSGEDVWLNSAEVRAWLQVDHQGLDDLVSSGILRARMSANTLRQLFNADEVAEVAALRGR
jgi:hypothetical protein